jgi:periplasmic divalent cation tolerance protein
VGACSHYAPPTMEADRPLVVLCTVPADGGHADRIAQSLVEARLAACVNVVGPVRSIYRWDGAVKEDAELQLLVKTRASRYAELEHHLRRVHPYEEPEILALGIEKGSASYLAWLAEQTEPSAAQ